MRTVAIVGSRTTPESNVLYFLASDLLTFEKLVSGGARGADKHAENGALGIGLSVTSYRPRREGSCFFVDLWVDGENCGPVKQGANALTYPDFSAAAKARNWWIARDCQRMVAHWDGVSSGTAHAVACAVRFDREIRIHMDGDS